MEKPPLIRQSMVDEEKRPPAWDYGECYNNKEENTVFGYYPDWGTAGVERAEVYVNYASDLGRLIEQPVTYHLPGVYARFPELNTPVDWRKILAQIKYSEWTQEPWRTPIKAIGEDFSLVNFLLEWKESLTLGKSWLSKKGLLRRWHALMSKEQSLLGKARAIANERLAYVYGTKLFLADAFRLWKIFTTWKERFAEFLEGAGKLERCYKKPLQLNLPITIQSSIRMMDYPVLNALNSTLMLKTTATCDMRAEMYYTYMVHDIKGMLARLSQIGDAYGVKLDAGIAWDAIPLSFVVDWFINVSEYLHANWSYGNWNKMEIRVLSWGHSARITTQQSVSWLRFYPAGGVHQYGPVTLLERNCTIYRRVRERNPLKFKEVDLMINNKKWSNYRIINATALILSRSESPQRKAEKLVRAFQDQQVLKQLREKAEKLYRALRKGRKR
jgi:hypothetical protein